MIRFIFINKILLLIFLIGLSIFLGYSFKARQVPSKKSLTDQSISKTPILRVALVADSHSDNENLRKALRQAGGMGINLVIGLGDYTNVGTLEELRQAKEIFDQSKLDYLLTAGDHDLWDSRDKGKDPLANFNEVFSQSSQVFEREKVLFVILDNSDIYSGIDPESWDMLNRVLSERIGFESNSGEIVNCQLSIVKCAQPKLRFVFVQKTPFHPDSKHVMGSESSQVADQAKELMTLLEEKKVDGFFSGDLHFFAEFSSKGGSTSGGKSPAGSVKMTTVGAVAAQRNFQGPRFAILTVFDDYSFDVEDVEIR